jgi:DNA repair ATPase RecN
MDDRTTMWLFATVFACIAGGATFILNFSVRLTKIESKQELFFDLIGKKIAKLLHSPDDHLGIDDYLDKYLDHHYDLSHQEWITFKEKLEGIINSEQSSTNEKLMAAFLSALCEHKINPAFLGKG